MALSTPSLTLYVSGIDTKTKKPELRQQLYSLFTPFGRVVDIIAKKHDGGRGQAFVVFDEQAAATSAMRTLSGELFYDKELRITYSRNPSNATLARTNPEASREAAAVRAAKMTVSNAAGEYEQLEKERAAEEERAAGGMGAGAGKRELEDGEGEAGPAAKKARSAVSGAGMGAGAAAGGRAGGEEAEEVEMEMDDDDDEDDEGGAGGSGKVLVCSNLPAECNEQIMSALYSQYPGFVKAAPLPSSRSVPASHPAPNAGARSFVVMFETAAQASSAMGETKGYLMQPGWEMGVSAE